MEKCQRTMVNGIQVFIVLVFQLFLGLEIFSKYILRGGKRGPLQRQMYLEVDEN